MVIMLMIPEAQNRKGTKSDLQTIRVELLAQSQGSFNWLSAEEFGVVAVRPIYISLVW